jgi:esterase/lipase
MKVLFSGSFKFFDEMKKLKEDLKLAGFECILPRFSLGNGYSSEEIEKIKLDRKKRIFELNDGKELQRIVKVKKWYYDQLRKCDAIVVFDLGGYVGLSVAAEIGAAHILEKPVFFLEKPSDEGILALIKFSKNFKIVPKEKLVKELKNLNAKRIENREN